MKAIVFTDSFAGGGAERVASLLINGLSQIDGNVVHVCVFEDVNNYNIQKGRVKFHVLADPQKGHLFNTYLKICGLTKVIRKEKPDVIFSFGPIMAGYVYLAKLFSGRKSLRVIDSERNDPRYEPVQNWKKRVRNFCYNHADLLVCQTPMAVDILRNRYGVLVKMVIIPNPITPNLPMWKGENSKDIITACRLTEQKNLPLLIRAFKRVHKEHPEFRLTIYGEGELRNALQTLINDEGMSEIIKMPGFAKDIHEIMSKAYMYVSSSDYEGISNSMLEALGIGLPCICTDCPVGGAAMYIKDGVSGILTKVNDFENLSLAMKRLIEDRDYAIEISQASRSVNSELTLEKITAKWIEITK